MTINAPDSAKQIPTILRHETVLQRSWLEKGNVQFVILYNEDTLSANRYRVFRVHHHAVMSEERMRKALYPNPTGNYFCFVFDEEVQLMPHIDVAKIVAMQRLNTQQVYIDGTPIILSGNDLHSYFIE